jgi:hypothetical protein
MARGMEQISVLPHDVKDLNFDKIQLLRPNAVEALNGGV